MTVNNIDKVNSSSTPKKVKIPRYSEFLKLDTSLFKVPGVGYENSLRMSLNSTISGESIKYRIFISEVGTTVSKVRNSIRKNLF